MEIEKKVSRGRERGMGGRETERVKRENIKDGEGEKMRE